MPKIVDHEQRRREISAVVAGLIAAGGLEAATFREIAQSSGYSKGVVEHYFEDKEELIGGALTWANECYEVRAAKATEGLSGLAALEKRIEVTLPMDRVTRDEWKVRLVFWSMAAIQPELRELQSRRQEMAIDFFERDISAAVVAGEVDDNGDVRAQARRLIYATTGISTSALHSVQLHSRQFLVSEVKHLVERVALGTL